MPKTLTCTVYEYDELSDKAKEAAREWYTSGDWDWFDSTYVIEDAERMGALMGIEFDKHEVGLMSGNRRSDPSVWWSGFWSQGDGASFDGTYRYVKGGAKAVKSEAPQDAELHRISQGLQDVQRKHMYQLRAKCKVSSNYIHSDCMDVEVWDDRDEYRDIGDADKEVRELLRDFADWIYEQLEQTYEYQSSEEVVADTIRANKYTFTEDGKRKD